MFDFSSISEIRVTDSFQALRWLLVTAVLVKCLQGPAHSADGRGEASQPLRDLCLAPLVGTFMQRVFIF